MICTLIKIEQGKYRCENCPRVVVTDHPIERIRLKCQYGSEDRSAACIHLGQQLGLEECTTCSGRVRIKTFECDVWAKCTLSQCRKCKDYLTANVDSQNEPVIMKG